MSQPFQFYRTSSRRNFSGEMTSMRMMSSWWPSEQPYLDVDVEPRGSARSEVAAVLGLCVGARS